MLESLLRFLPTPLGSAGLLYACMGDYWVLVLKGKRNLDKNIVRNWLCHGHSGREAWGLGGAQGHASVAFQSQIQASGACTACRDHIRALLGL